jgi:two-component system OmpR family response regulator
VRVLVVEDDANLRLAVEVALRGAGFAVDTVGDLPAADQALYVNAYDCAVFDRMLPVGREVHDSLHYVARRRQAGWNLPVLFLTARDSTADRVEGLRLGGGDYLVKPFGMAELVARVVSLCRRATLPIAPVLRFADVELDRDRHEVRRAGVLLTLTHKQFLILERLLAAPGEPVRQQELHDCAWDEAETPASNVLAVTINQLRRRLGDPPLIENIRGIGYRICLPG